MQQKDTTQIETNTTHDEWLSMPIGIFFHPDLTDLEKKVWFQVYRYDGSENHCTASNRTLGEIVGAHHLSVSRAITALIGHKLLALVSEEPRVLRRTPDYLNQIRHISEQYNKLVYKKSINHTVNPPLTNGLTPPIPGGIPNSKSIEKKSLKRKDVPTVQVADATDAAINSLPSKIQVVFTYWKNRGLHLPGVETKAWGKSIDMINGLFTGAAFTGIPELREYKRKYSIEEIKLSIDRFAQAVNDPDVIPVNKSTIKSMSPNTFIYNNFCKPQKEENLFGRSYFLHFLIHNPSSSTRTEPLRKDEHPELTQQLIHEYNSTVLGGLNPKITIPNHNKFILAAKKLHAFVNEFRSKFNDHSDLSNRNVAKLLVDSIVEDQHGVTEKISPGYLCSDETFTRRFPAHLYQMAIIKEDVEGKPWKYANRIFSVPLQYGPTN